MQIFGGYNWYNLTFFWCALEFNKMFGYADFDFVILGFGFHLTYSYPHEETETEKKIRDRIEEIKDKYDR